MHKSKNAAYSVIPFTMRLPLGFGYFGVLATLTLLLGQTNSITVLPHPNGTFTTNFGTLQLVDNYRLDPFAPTPQPRTVMVSAWYPVSKQPCRQPRLVDYMGPATARNLQDMYFSFAKNIPNGTFESFKLQVCGDYDTEESQHHYHHPLVLFDIGLGISRHGYNSLIQDFASQGYIVVTMDHPYDSSIIEYPDGTTVLGIFGDDNITESQLNFAMATRVKDAVFVLDQLALPYIARNLVPYMTSGFDTSKVPMFGHSFGGSAAIATAQNETRLAGAANLDGTQFLVNRDIKCPALIFGSVGHNRSNDASWAIAWPYLKGWKTAVDLQQGRHLTFSDYPLIIKLLGIIDQLPDGTREGYRYPDALRSKEIITTYIGAFLRLTLGGEADPLLINNSTQFPEIRVETLNT